MKDKLIFKNKILQTEWLKTASKKLAFMQFRPVKFILTAVSCIVLFSLFFFLCLRIIPFPELSDFLAKEYSIRIYDRNDKLIQVTPLSGGGRREFTPYSKIPEKIIRNFIQQEDKRFYFHHGVDYIAAANSIVQSIRAKRIVRGASTISMQLSKTIQQDNSISLKRKMSNIISAYRIEAKLTKKQILELYLNSIYFGNNVWGVTSGARTYFGMELDELTEGQIKVLSVIPRNPSYYNPVEHPDRFKNFSDEVFEAASSAGFPISAVFPASDAPGKELFSYPYRMPHFVNFLKAQLRAPFSELASERSCTEIHTTADIAIYEMANAFLRNAMQTASRSRIANASLLLLDNSDGSVLAWIGNGNFFDSRNSGQLDGVLVTNQPGSSMKPFLYALAIENGLAAPASVLADVPSEFGNEKLYIPENFNNRFNGPVRLRVALASSLNIPAVSLLNKLGVQTYLDKLYELGFNSLKKNNSGLRSDLGLALGAGEVSLYELVPAFSVFVRDGIYLPLKIVRDDNENPLLLTGQKEGLQKTVQETISQSENARQIFSTDTARLICSILSDKASRSLGFGYSQTFQTEYPSIFKTGTSNQYQDIIALGATKHYTIGVWMGNFSGSTVIGKTGSSLPAWVAKNVLDNLELENYRHSVHVEKSGKEYSLYNDFDFPEPENWHKERICAVSGMKAGRECKSSVYEYVKNENDIPECTWHVLSEGEIKTVYPADYQLWLKEFKGEEAGNTLNSVIEYSDSPLKIITPKENALFFSSNSSSERQAIPVEVTGGKSDRLLVYYDSSEFAEFGRPFSFKLPVEQGEHQLKVICGLEELSINYTVK
ncbi:MAG: transglycosylase domain-containing protein [Treponema sp.]|nr:transglycosylase domain-containing protein [Treponema sp.]